MKGAIGAKEWRMHNILLLRRRFPHQSGLIVRIILTLSVMALLVGAGLLLLG
jgi:hypothetical protein